MRGGGGSTYAVLINYKFKVHPAQPMNVYDFRATLQTPATDLTQSEFHRTVVTALAQKATLQADNKIAGYNFLGPGSFQSIHMSPTADTENFQRVLGPWKELLESQPGLNIVSSTFKTAQNYQEYTNFTVPFMVNSPIGVGNTVASRLIPQSQFATPDSINQLVDTYLQGMQISLQQGARGLGHIYMSLPFNEKDDNKKTSVHPAWRQALWHAVYPTGFLPNTTLAAQDSLSATVMTAIQGLEALTPGGGAYANEAAWKKEDWEDAFWGENYPALLRIKQQYDPEGLFNCFKCVGWRGPTE